MKRSSEVAVPENGEGLAGAAAQALWDHASSNGSDSRANAQASQGALIEKRKASAAARAALIGATLTEVADDAGRPEFILSRWGYTRAFPGLAEVELMLDRMGAPK